MQFLYPIGLLALAGLIVPLIIHLWNIKQGKTLKIGSITLLGERSSASSRSFRINDWLLLILRCLLLIIIAFILAQPVIKKTLPIKNSGWILVQKSNLLQVYKDNRRMIDSLIKRGYELHEFNTAFATLNLKDTADTQHSTVTSLSYSHLLNQLNDVLPSGSQVFLFADRRLANLESGIPQMDYNLNWKTLNETDTTSSWIAEYAGIKYEAASNPSNTTYTRVKNNDAGPIKIAIYEPSGTNDRKYLIAALRAISGFSNRRLEINPESKADIGFWLSDEPVSRGFKSSIEHKGTLFQYEKGRVIPEASFLRIEGESISSTKRIQSPETLDKIWVDGFGNTILGHEQLSNLNIYHFYSRFNPQWNQLVWNGVFVKALMPVVIQDPDQEGFGFKHNAADQRQLADEQQTVVKRNAASGTVQKTTNAPVNHIYWVLALLLFTIERILSFRKKTIVYVKN
ncbi:BatA domain-containing protein [Pedobacter sp. BMA]|uniref:BatA domain-containing protein n=1 Tax=Pedobacter sp. BMA TaxID=1663685 RepID=UPI0006499AF9|nr:BatA domain-containing protein [Pedobacter sp. BMA]KLT65408.1 hypothetical protein AB669_09995 [Pedobacter sp. BMA]